MTALRPLLVVLFLVLHLFSGCNPKPEQSDEFRFGLDAIRQRGYINALVDNNSFSYFIYKGRPMGFEYELLSLFADYLKVDLKIKVISGVDNALDQLISGEGDVLAFPLTITKERREKIDFSRPLFNSYQVLVQRKPDQWRSMTRDQMEDSLIRNASDLIDKEVHVMKSSSFAQRLRHLSEEIGGDIHIVEDSAGAQSESLIERVAMKQIDYTVTDHQIAMVNAAYYPNLDVSTILSLPQHIAWGVRKDSPKLMAALNDWLASIKKKPTFMVIYNRYFKSPRTSLIRNQSDYSSINGTKISPYDNLIKAGAKRLGWDWRLLAAIVYQESKFKTNDESWAGARGLMQLMPETAERFGASDRDDPAQSMRAGVNYLRYLDRYWSKSIDDPAMRVKFVLASYNVGLSHVIDARKLAAKYGGNSMMWDDQVEQYLLKKSDPTYYRDPVAPAGYCRCEEPVNYVKDVLERYEQYKAHIKE